MVCASTNGGDVTGASMCDMAFSEGDSIEDNSTK
jgi:hypothetical protein